MQQRVITVPDLNVNKQIEAIAGTAGAWAGALVTAAVGGVGTGVVSFGKWVAAGAQVTHGNYGQQKVVVEDKSIAARSLQTVPANELQHIDPNEVLEALQLLRAMKQQKQDTATQAPAAKPLHTQQDVAQFLAQQRAATTT